MAKPKNVVLVHGGFVDGSGWHDVYQSPPARQRTMAARAGATVAETPATPSTCPSRTSSPT